MTALLSSLERAGEASDAELLKTALARLSEIMIAEGPRHAMAWSRLPDDTRQLMAGAYIRGVRDAALRARGQK